VVRRSNGGPPLRSIKVAKKSKKKASKKKAVKKVGKKVAKRPAKKAAKKKARRTVMYSSAGKKLYAVRDKGGKFKDIQQYSRAHAMDIKRHDADDKDEQPGA
jgi:hypothetical protein